MAFVIENSSFPRDPFRPDVYGSWLSSAAKKVKKTVGSTAGKVVGAVKTTGREVDITSSKSFTGRIPVIGKKITQVARMGVGSSTAVLTGGLSILAAERGLIPKSTFGVRTVAQAAATAAVVGLAIASGGSLATVASAGMKALGPVSSAPGGGGALPVEPVASPPAVTPDTPSGLSFTGPLLGAGAGFLVGGPVGAIIGGGAAFALARRGSPGAGAPAQPLSGYPVSSAPRL